MSDIFTSIEDAAKQMYEGTKKMDMTQITAIVQSIVAAAPAIEQGIISIEPYVEAIVTMIKTGGAPADADWTALKARLDAGSADLQSAAQSAEAELGATPTQE